MEGVPGPKVKILDCDMKARKTASVKHKYSPPLTSTG